MERECYLCGVSGLKRIVADRGYRKIPHDFLKEFSGGFANDRVEQK